MDFRKISSIIRGAKEQSREVLLETEGLAMLEAMGIKTPKYFFIRNPIEAREKKFNELKSSKVVVKVISPDILHKTDVGGVVTVDNSAQTITTTIAEMEKRFANSRLVGFTINEFISYTPALGRELLFGMRWTEDFGPIVSLNAGGIYAEFIAKNFKQGSEVAVFSPNLVAGEPDQETVKNLSLLEIIGGGYRNQEPLVSPLKISSVLSLFSGLALNAMPDEIKEFEINPMVMVNGELVALDVLVKLGTKKDRTQVKRPLEKIKNLLQPRTVAIIGVSEKMNPGHIILNNLIEDGFEKEKIYIVKPGSQSIEGCKCYNDVLSLPEKVDLFILSVSAAQVPEVVTDVIEYQKAESLIVIPGGLEEKKGTEAIIAEMKAALLESRQTDWRGPVLNGGNCLGIRSVPGRYNTLFIPKAKLPIPIGKADPVALVSQSGAFAISRISNLSTINPKFVVTLGNQMDLTIGDYLTYLKDDSDLEVFAVYVEGFKQFDGLNFLKAAQEISKKGKTVILYRAGRTAAGAQASASHTASIAGDYSVTRELCSRAGIVLADTLSDFEELIKLFTFLHDKKVSGLKLGAISNAGCECVAIADNLGRFELPELDQKTVSELGEIFKQAGISEIVDIHNPIDLTPMANDEAYEKTFSALLSDSRINVGVLGVVPLTAALNTLSASSSHKEDFTKNGSIANRLIALKERTKKPWIVVVDSGVQYDEMVGFLERNRVPVFRKADVALKLFNIICQHKLEK